jgi:hypothetical protein
VLAGTRALLRATRSHFSEHAAIRQKHLKYLFLIQHPGTNNHCKTLHREVELLDFRAALCRWLNFFLRIIHS